MIPLLVDVASALGMAALLVLGAAAVPRATRWIRRAPREAAMVAALFVVALGLRLEAPAAPARWGSALEHAMAPFGSGGGAWVGAIRALWAITGPSDALVFGIDAALGAATVVALFALARRLGLGLPAAVLGAGFLATHEAHIRYSHTDSPQIAQAFLVVLFCALLVGEQDRLTRLGSGLALSLGLAMDPDAIVLAPLLAILPWAAKRTLVREDGLTLAAALVGLPACLLGAPDAIGRFAHFAPVDTRYLVGSADWTTLSFTLGALLGLIGLADLRIRVWAAAFGLAAVAAGAGGPEVHLEAIEAQLLALPVVALLAGLGLERILVAAWERSRVAAGALALAAVALVGLRLGDHVRPEDGPTTLATVYAETVYSLDRVPDGCTILYRTVPGNPKIVPPQRLSLQRGAKHLWLNLAGGEQPYDSCQVYYRSAACYIDPSPPREGPVREGPPRLHPECTKAELQLKDLTELATHPALAVSTGAERYGSGTEPMLLGFFDLEEPRDPTKPIQSAPPKPRTGDDIVRRRDELSKKILALPEWSPPAGWDLVTLAEVLESGSCPADDIRCSSNLCVAISTDPDCQRSAWHAATRQVGSVEVSRFTWADQAEGFQASAVALVPVDARADPDVQSRVNAMARLLLLDALYP